MTRARRGGAAGAALLWCAVLAGPATAATVVVNNVNAPGEGFNDPTPAAPVAGNAATTVGAQRLAAFQAAADQWGATLDSDVTITIDAQMTSLSCNTNSAVLGSAGPRGFVDRDFPEAPAPGTWYPQALVNALRGVDIDPSRGDVSANFNQDIGTPGCLQSLGWAYVIGAPAPPGTIPFTDTVLHEIAHGLGFLTFADRSTGALFDGFSDHYTQHLLDETPTPTLWTDLDDAGRAASATDTGQLTWNGPNVADVAGLLTGGRHPTSGRVRMYAPGTLVGGSSVSHFDTALRPREIMEPSLRLPNRKRLTNHLMLDLGWTGLASVTLDLDDGETSLEAGSLTSYALTLENDGPADLTVVAARVNSVVPAGLNAISWTCSASGGAVCGTASGTGAIDSAVTLPLGGGVTFTIDGAIDPGFTGTLTKTASVTLPDNIRNTTASQATDETSIIEPAVPGVLISSATGDTSEAGQPATFQVALNTQPAADVIVPLSSSDPREGSLSASSLTFTSANWDAPQSVTVIGVDDDIDDGDVFFTVQTGPTSSDDDDYDGLDPTDVGLTNLDDDTAGISVSPLSGDTTEAGGTATFTVVLNSEPLADVEIGLASSEPGEATVSTSALVFTPGNWDAPQQVTVTGVDDFVDDGDVPFRIVTAPASSGDGGYNGLDGEDPTATNQDDDTAGITVSMISGDTDEDGASAVFLVVLDSEPTAAVTIVLASSDQEEGTVAPDSLTFTPANWDTPQPVTVTGVSDDLNDGDVAYTVITAPAISADPGYDGIDPADVDVLNVDTTPLPPDVFKDGFELGEPPAPE